MKEKKHIGIFMQIGLDPSDDKIQASQIKVDAAAKEVEDWYRRYTRHVWDIQVRGYVMQGIQSTRPPVYARTDVREFMESHDMEGFEPNYFHVWGGYETQWCGMGNIPGDRSATFRVSGVPCGVKTMIHELGHNMGLFHASSDTNGNVSTYGDGTSFMGGGTTVRGMNSRDMIKLRLEDPREILEIDSSQGTQQVLLAPIELAKHELHANEYQHLRIRKDRKFYSVSIRKEKYRGGFYHVGESPETLYLHYAPYSDESLRYLPDMEVGDKRKLPDGAVIEYLEYKDETARINVYYNAGDPRPVDIEMPVGFPVPTVITAPVPKHNGLWYNKDFNGEGFDIHISNNLMTLYWYTYNQQNDSRRFYVGTCPLGEGALEFDLHTTTGGTYGDPTKHDTINIGKAQLSFLDENNAIFSFNTTEHGRGSVEIIPAILSIDARNGVYYDPTRNGEGYSIQFFDELNSCIVYFYSYGPTSGRGITEQRWYWCHGSRKADGTYALELWEPSGTWMGFRDKANLKLVGSGALEPQSVGGGMLLKYTLDSDTVTGSRTDQLIKLN